MFLHDLGFQRAHISSAIVEGCANGDATERRSAYVKASANAEAMADKLADKYDPLRLCVSARKNPSQLLAPSKLLAPRSLYGFGDVWYNARQRKGGETWMI